MANLLLKSRDALRVGINWPSRFVERNPELQMRYTRSFDFQRALCEDPDAIYAWFRPVANIKAKYRIVDNDFYNFDETGFMIGIIEPSMIVVRAGRLGEVKISNQAIGNGPQSSIASMVKDGACCHIHCLKANIIFRAGTPNQTFTPTGWLKLQKMDGQIMELA